jgi:hypothetical protein
MLSAGPSDGCVGVTAHEIIESPFQAEKEVRMRRLGHVCNSAVGQDQVEADNGVNCQTILAGLVGVSCWMPVSMQSSEAPPKTNRRQARSRLHQSVMCKC